MQQIVVFGEKPAMTRACAPHLVRAYPNATIHVVHNLLLGPASFRVPRGLTYANLPVTIDLIWQPRKGFHHLITQMLPDGTIKQITPAPDYAALLADADQVVFAADYDATACRNFEAFLHLFLPAGGRAKARHAYRITSLADADLAKCFSKPLSFNSDGFSKHAEYGMTKAYFDVNYSANAFPVLGNALRAVGLPTDPFPLSKYGLQLLYWSRRNGPHRESAVLNAMLNWRGTGKHLSPYVHLGSSVSTYPIVRNLLDGGLFVANGKDVVGLSDKALQFLSLLHPRCEDADLPFRIDAWGKAGLHASKASIDLYIRTYFGKQMRYQQELVTS